MSTGKIDWSDDPDIWMTTGGHGWVRRAKPEAEHVCPTPTRVVTRSWPSGSLDPNAKDGEFTSVEIGGSLGDLWRCSCGSLWRVGDACDLCDFGRARHGGQCRVGRKWRPASWWQRLRYRSKP